MSREISKGAIADIVEVNRPSSLGVLELRRSMGNQYGLTTSAFEAWIEHVVTGGAIVELPTPKLRVQSAPLLQSSAHHKQPGRTKHER